MDKTQLTRVRPFNKKELSVARQEAEKRLKSWASEWCVESGTVKVQEITNSTYAGLVPQKASKLNLPTLVCAESGEVNDDVFAACLYGKNTLIQGGKASELLKLSAERAKSDLLNAFRMTMGKTAREALLAGMVEITFFVSGKPFMLVVSQNGLAPLGAKPSQSATLKLDGKSVLKSHVTEREQLSFNLKVNGGEHSLAALRKLAIGDVIAFDHGITTPVSLEFVGEKNLKLKGYLGKNDERLAVQLTSSVEK